MDPASLVFVSVVASMFGSAFYGLFALNRREQAKLDEAWQKAARTVRGTVETSPLRRLTVTLNGVTLVATDDPPPRVRSTTIRAGTRAAGSFALTVRRATTLERTLLGSISTGDDAFDTACVCESNSRALARLWLDSTTRAAIRASGDWRFSLGGGELVVHHPRMSDEGSLTRALRSAAAVAARGNRLAREWSALAERLDGSVTKPIALGNGELGAITIERPGLVLSLVLTAEGDDGTTTLKAATTTQHEPPEQAKFADRALALGARAMRFDEGHVTIELERLVVNAPVLEPLVDLVFEAAAAKVVGPYR